MEKEDAQILSKLLLEHSKWEDEMIFDHGPLIIGSRELPVKDRFEELIEAEED